MFKLSLGLRNIKEKIKNKLIYSFDNLYDDLIQQSTFQQKKTPKIQQPSTQQHAVSPPPKFRIIQQKQLPNQTNQIIHNTKKSGKQLQILIKLEQQEHLLLSRKKKLLTELNQINSQLKTQHYHQSRIRQVSKPQINSYEMTQKAQELVKRMNKQRQEFSQRRTKSIEELNQSIAKSIQQFHLSLAEEEKMKEIRRHQIQNRINERKKKAIQRGISVDMTHSLLQQFIDNTLKLQYHSQISPQTFSIENIQQNQSNTNTMKPIRFKSHGSQMYENQNPEHHESTIPRLPHIKTEQSKQSLKSSTKSYSKSPFLVRILKEDQIKKKQSYLKTLEKKRVYLRQKQYAEKIRNKTYESNSTFLT